MERAATGPAAKLGEGIHFIKRQAGMSRSTFAARFHALVGETPAAYLMRWRVAPEIERVPK